MAVADDAAIEVRDPPRFVSRGGDKLATMLDRLGWDVDAAPRRSTSAPRRAASRTACCSAARRG